MKQANFLSSERQHCMKKITVEESAENLNTDDAVLYLMKERREGKLI